MTSSEFRDSFITICMWDRDNRGDTVFITIEYALSEQSHITHHMSATTPTPPIQGKISISCTATFSTLLLSV